MAFVLIWFLLMIYYWKGAAGSQDLLATHADAIQRLLRGDYNASDLEKLRCRSDLIIYSYRLNQADRLLFTTHKDLLHVLEFIPNHHYQKSRFLKTGVLRAYLSHVEMTKETLFSPLLDTEEKPFFSNRISNISLNTGFDYYNQKFVSPSPLQAQVVEQVTLPLILNGVAGSGKTYVAFAMLKNALEASVEAMPRGLYISKEAHLVSSMSLNWEHYFSPAMDASQGTVDFKTYDNLLADLQSGHPIVEATYFHQWFLTLKKNDRIPLHTESAFYQEFRICSGLDREAYVNLGERQSLILPRDGRMALYDCYLSYLASLRGRIDPVFSPCLNDISSCYDFIVVDEAHGFSLLQNLALARLAKSNAIVYCLDPHQNLDDQSPTRVLLEVQLRAMNITTVTLDQTYRCSQQVAKALNQIIENNRCILEGKIDKQEASSLFISEEATEGELHMLALSEVENNPWLLARAQGVNLAVVTQPDYVDEARVLFKTPLVFTPAQIQGQEYHTLVVYKLLSDDYSKKVLKNSLDLFEKNDMPVATHRSKSKTNQAHAYAPWAHLIFTACSRAMHGLVIIDQSNRYWDKLRLSVPAVSVTSEPVLPTLPTAWITMAEVQNRFGNEDIARRINTEKIDLTPKKNVTPPSSGRPKGKPSRSLSRRQDPTPITKMESGSNLLNALSKNKNISVILRLINDQSIDLNRVNSKGLSAITIAALSRRSDILQALIATDDRIDLNLKHKGGYTALMIATQQSHTEIVQALIATGDRIDLNLKNEEGFTALMMAAQQDDTGIVQAFIATGDRIDLNLENENGFTALMIAAQQGNAEIVRALIATDDRIDLNLKHEAGFTALMMAAQQGCTEIVQALIATGDRIDLNLTHKGGYTALMIAAEEGFIDIALALIATGDRIDLNKNRYDTALMIAAEKNCIDIVQALIATGDRIDLNLATEDGYTALMVAAEKGFINLAQALIATGDRINLNLATADGFTALMMAAEKNCIDIAQALIATGGRIDLNKAESGGYTALMIAIEYGCFEIIVALIATGHRIDLNKANAASDTALIIAARAARMDIFKCIVSTERINENYLAQGLRAMLLIETIPDDIISTFIKKHGAVDDIACRRIITSCFSVDHKQNVSNERIRHILTIKGMLHFLLRTEFDKESTSMITFYPILVVHLIQKREDCWAILKSPDFMGLSDEEHNIFLQSIANENKNIHKILFQKVPEKGFLVSHINTYIEVIRGELQDKLKSRDSIQPPGIA